MRPCHLPLRIVPGSAVLSHLWRMLWVPLKAVVACSRQCPQVASAAVRGATRHRQQLAVRRAASGARAMVALPNQQRQ